VTLTDVLELTKQYGVGIVLVAIFLILLARGVIRLGRETDQSKKDEAAWKSDCQQQIADLRKDYERQITDLRKDYENQITALRADIVYFRGKAEDYQEKWAGALDTGEAASRIATRVVSRR
jgi:hypothetical protein